MRLNWLERRCLSLRLVVRDEWELRYKRLWPRSSIGKSVHLLSERMLVQIESGPPKLRSQVSGSRHVARRAEIMGRREGAKTMRKSRFLVVLILVGSCVAVLLIWI